MLIYAYGVARTTNDVDFISLTPSPLRKKLVELAGEGSKLHKKHKVYLDPVAVATAPDGYQNRLHPLFPGIWKNIELYALEAHDVALAKLERNAERDRDDVLRLAAAGHLDQATLQARYVDELRPYLVRENWHDQIIELWIESCWPEGGSPT